MIPEYKQYTICTQCLNHEDNGGTCICAHPVSDCEAFKEIGNET